MRLRRAAIFAVIRVLAEDDDLHIIGTRETQRAEDVGGIDGFTGGALTVDETAKRRVGIAFDEGLQVRAPRQPAMRRTALRA